MPTNCNFYILTDARENGRFLFCCALIEKLNAHGHRIYVHCQDKNDAVQFNNLLWTYKDISFIPHCLSGEYDLVDCPVQIGFQAPSAEFNDILIFLSALSDVPDFYKQFSRTVEIVNKNPFIKERLRMHFQYYRSQGNEIKAHTL